MSNDPGKKKIIIDEDWKSQVEAEREAAAKAEDQPETASGDAMDGPEGAMPPASFGMLLSTLATEAMVSLGQIPHPASGQPMVNLEGAKFFIDTLALLQEKTKGNLEPEEKNALDDMVSQLRMAFVAVNQSPPDGPAPGVIV